MHQTRHPLYPDGQREEHPHSMNGYRHLPPPHQLPPPQPPSNNDYAIGSTLGQLLAGQDRTIYVLELIAAHTGELQHLPSKIIDSMPKPNPPPSKRRLPPLRDMIQIALLISIILTGFIKGTPIGELLIKAGRAYGF